MIVLLTIGIAVTIALGFGAPTWWVARKSDDLTDWLIALIITFTAWLMIFLLFFVSYQIAKWALAIGA